MPPKTPALKFKPKLVMRGKQPPSPPSDDIEGLTLLQLERLRLQQSSDQGRDRATELTSTTAESTSAPAPPVSSPTRGRRAVAGKESKLGARGTASPQASLQQASLRYVDVHTYPEEAEPLPENTMDSIVVNDNSDNGVTIYRPTPLDSSLAAKLSTRVAAVSESAETSMHEHVDGTSFVRAHEDELRRVYEANRRFYNETLSASSDLSWQADEAAGPGCTDGSFVWLQLPRFHSNPPFVLDQLPPGKVGELKVMRSGRMVLDICGVYYDVAAESIAQGDDGPCSMVAVTQPPQYPMNPASKPSCYEVGRLARKLVCTPTIDE